MKKRFWIMAILAAACTTLLAFSGCWVEFSSSFLNYAYADQYTAGGGSVQGNVTELEIDWIDGSVEISYGDVENVTFTETSKETLSEEKTVHYWLENMTLHLKFAKAKESIKFSKYPDKDLKVVLPRGTELKKLDLKAIDTSVKIDNVSISDVEIDGVDGEVNAYLVGTTREISIDTTDGDITIKGDEILDFDIDIVGADVYVESVIMPKEGSFDSVGGSLTLALYDGIEGFSVEFDTVGGKFQSDFDAVKNGDTYVYGNGGGVYEADTVGGDVKIVKKAAN